MDRFETRKSLLNGRNVTAIDGHFFSRKNRLKIAILKPRKAQFDATQKAQSFHEGSFF